MLQTLKQRHFLTIRCFELTENGLKIQVKKPFKNYEEEFSFEHIVKSTFKNKSYSRLFLVLSCFALIGFFITTFSHFGNDKTVGIGDVLFYVILCGIFIPILWSSYIRSINLKLSDQRHILFYHNYPSRQIVEDFINSIFESQKENLLKKYAVFDPYLSEITLAEQLQWLKAREIIDQNEYDNLCAKLLKPIPEQIGFKFTSQN